MWICGRLIGEWEDAGSVWAFQGVFSEREFAVNACKDETYFIFSAEMDKQLPYENSFPPDGCYPIIENELKEKD